MRDITLQVSQAIDLINSTLDQAYPFILIEGEVSEFKVNQNKFVFFNIKDESSTLGCFMMAFQLKFPLQDGMKIKVLAQPKLTSWGKFSLTVKELVPVGEGSLKKSLELLKSKLQQEGLFDESRKRKLPKFPKKIGIVSSVEAAGYKDFLKILENRWGGLEITAVNVNVQGMDAPTQLISALNYLNELNVPLDVIAIIRGGGSMDDLSAFNHEDVVRSVSLSRSPTISGVGHETDTTLVDLVADVRAATPSNAAEIIVPDRKAVIENTQNLNKLILNKLNELIDSNLDEIIQAINVIEKVINNIFNAKQNEINSLIRTVKQLDPNITLRRGYAVVKSKSTIITSVSDVKIKDRLTISVSDGDIDSEVIGVNN